MVRPAGLLQILTHPSPDSYLEQYSVTSQVTQGSLEGVVLWIVMCVPLPATLRCYLCASGYVRVHPPPATWLFLFRNQLDNRYSVQGLGRVEA